MSEKIYCVAQFLPKEGREKELFDKLKALEPESHKEEGCIQYTITKHISNPFADGESYPLAFNEIWKNKEAFEEHCQREEIQNFFQSECLSEDGSALKWNVCTYTDEY